MMRFWGLALVLLTVAFAGPAYCGESDAPPRLFQSEGGEAGPEVDVRLWLTSGSTKVVSYALQDKFRHDDNLLVLIEGEMPLPGYPLVSVWGRMGMTIFDKEGTSDAGDSDAKFGLFEVNLGVCLVGRGSPLVPNHDLPESYLQAYVGLRVFQESFEADAAGDNQLTYDTLWYGPQLGLRGYWHLGDSYPEESLTGWGLSAGVTLLPVLMLDAQVDHDTGRDSDQKSGRGYGYSWFVGASYRTRTLVFTLGYEFQRIKTDEGDEDVSGTNRGDLFSLESERWGPFFSLGILF
jgi:hypothetical protein